MYNTDHLLWSTDTKFWPLIVNSDKHSPFIMDITLMTILKRLKHNFQFSKLLRHIEYFCL